MIDKLKYKIDRKGNVGVKATSIVRIIDVLTGELDKPAVRIETTVFFGTDGQLLQPMVIRGNIFTPTNDYSLRIYFPFNQIAFIGKAIIQMNNFGDYLSIAISQANYHNSAISAYNGKGDILMSWTPIQPTEELLNMVKQYCSTFVY